MEKDFIANTYNNVPAYNRLLEEKGLMINELEHKNLPVMTKDRMIENEDAAIAPMYVYKLLNGELINCRTSGSTGKYLDIFWDESDFKRSMLSLWYYRYKYYGIRTNDKMCFFYTINPEENNGEVRKNNQWGFSKINLSMERMKEIYLKMSDFEPEWMLLQPSIAVLLCSCVEKYALRPLDSLKYIEFTGEMLSEAVRNRVKGIFKCHIANQYGANEVNSIAYECPNGHLHIMSDNVVVRVINRNKKAEQGEPGNICVTSLHNRAMPFINYDIGDMGIIKESCKCEYNKSSVLELTAGRSSSYIDGTNGKRINSYVFVQIMDRVNAITDGGIKQFQIVEKAKGNFLVKMVVDDEIPKEVLIECFYHNILENSLKEATFNFEFHAELFPDSETGKLSYLVKEE